MKYVYSLVLIFLALPLASQVEEVFEFENSGGLSYDLKFQFGDRLYFNVRDNRMTLNTKLWVTDGTAQGTSVALPLGISGTHLFEERRFVVVSSRLYEINPDNYEIELYSSVNYTIEQVLQIEDKIAVLSKQRFSTGLWFSAINVISLSDGANETIFQGNVEVNNIAALDDKVLFTYENNIYASNETGSEVVEILNGASNQIRDLDLSKGGETNGKYVFQVWSNNEGIEPWVTDGTPSGTSLLADLSADGNSLPDLFFELGGELYFFAYSTGFDISLFKTDGTAANTVKVVALHEELDFERVYERYEFNGQMYIEATTASDGYELWTTDGTAAGTSIVKDIWEGAGSFRNDEYLQARSITDRYIYFSADDGIHGRELWRSDGTDAGTELVIDFAPGADWSFPLPLGVINGRVYFSDTDDSGAQLYSISELDPLPPATEFAPSYDWLRTMGYNFLRGFEGFPIFNESVETDGEGNVYVMGKFRRDALLFYESNNFIERSQLGDESSDRTFLASFDSGGDFRWGKEIGGGSFPRKGDITIDSENNVICAGTYFVRGVLDDVLLSNSNTRYYLAKYDSEGELLWYKQGDIGPTQNADVNSVETDALGNIYVAGTYTEGVAHLGPNQISDNSDPAIFIAQYDKDGNEVWLNHLPETTPGRLSYVRTIQVRNGRIYATVTDGDYNWESSCNFSDWYARVFALNQDGDIIDEKLFVSSDLTFVTDAKFSKDDHLHIVGTFRGDFDIDGTVLSAECGNSTGFMIKLDDQLNVLDAFEIETPDTYLQDIEFGDNSTYYLSGLQTLDDVPDSDFRVMNTTRDKVFVKKYDKFNRLVDERYFSKYHGDSFDSNPLMALDSDENIILSDIFRSQFDTFAVNRSFSSKIAIIKFSLDGEASYPEDGRLEESSVELFPNPARSFMTLTSEDEDFSNADFEVYDAIGRFILTPRVSYNIGVTQLDVSELPPGTYMLRISTESEQFSKKFLKVD
ncbi:MAG: ELWxxDGT repeat protein [Bacteroidota bacterium]